MRSILYILLIFTLGSCGKELPLFPEEKTYQLEPTVINGKELIKISGTINDSLYLSADQHYLLSGKCVVSASGSLGIEQGTTLYAEENAALIIERKGEIYALGTKEAPIVFTSLRSLNQTALTGDWIGVHINGQAGINGRSTPLVIEIGKYGRLEDEIDDDNSGILRYVKILYAGQNLGGSSGALNFNGCGSGTEVNHVQVYHSNGFGIRIRGGKVNLRHCVATQTQGTGIIWDNGWRGFGQSWLIHQTNLLPTDTITLMAGKSSVENNSPRSNPILANITIIGLQDQQSRGLRLNDATLASIYNMIITKTNRGLRVDYLEDAILNSELKVRNCRIFNNEIDYYDSESSTAGLLDKAFMGNTSMAINMQGFVGSANDMAIDPTTLDPWFEEENYVGAVKDDLNDWTKNWIEL